MIALSGCGPPCDKDPVGCGSGSEFSFASDCELAGPLEVELGEGPDEFTPLVDGQEPKVYQGNQGGRHMFLGLRVAEPALEYPQLKVVFDVELNDPERCAGDPGCDPWVSTGHREFVLGPDLSLDEQNRVEETDFVVVISIWPDDLERRLSLEVLDPCRREGSAQHLIPPAE